MHAAGLFLLATASFTAADVVGDGTRPYASQGACMDPTTQITVCFRPGATSSNPSLTQTECEAASNVWYAKGAVGSDGCCLCDSNCDHSLETAAAGTCNYADTNAGSCKIAASGQVICDVVASQCTSPNVWSAAGALDSDGCCFCDETCDHSAETGTDCHSKGYADESQSDGACYDFTTHTIDCDIGHAACDAMGAYWYSPGYISGSSGCCWCDASCDHSLETGTDCSSGYFGADGSPGSGGGHGAEYTFAPTPWPTGNGSCYDYVTFTWTCNVMESTCTTQSGGGYWYAPGYIGWNGCCWCDDAACDHSLETGTDCSSQYSKTSYWEAGSGWCSSDLDEYVGDTSTASACWTECEGRYGSDLVAIDWTPDGECYCQDDCQCMEDTEDSDIQLLTRSDVASLPDVCISACPAEEAAFEDCLSQQNSLDDDFFSGDDDDDGDDDDFSPQSCDDVQQHLSNGECEGPAVCQTEYQAYVECTYEDAAQSFLGLTCDFACARDCPAGSFDNLETCEDCDALDGDCADCECRDFDRVVEANCKAACALTTPQPTSAPSVSGAITLSGITVEDAEANKAVLQDAIARVAGVDTEAVTIQSVASARRRLQASVIVDYKIEADDFAAAEEASEKLQDAADDTSIIEAEIESSAAAIGKEKVFMNVKIEELSVPVVTTEAPTAAPTTYWDNKKKRKDDAMLLILIIVCSVAVFCCLLALGTAAAAGAFGTCACFAKRKKTRVPGPSEPPLAHATVMAEAPPLEGYVVEPSAPPQLAPIKATETLAAEMP